MLQYSVLIPSTVGEVKLISILFYSRALSLSLSLSHSFAWIAPLFLASFTTGSGTVISLRWVWVAILGMGCRRVVKVVVGCRRVLKVVVVGFEAGYGFPAGFAVGSTLI
jgi:hypothetical protein